MITFFNYFIAHCTIFSLSCQYISKYFFLRFVKLQDKTKRSGKGAMVKKGGFTPKNTKSPWFTRTFVLETFRLREAQPRSFVPQATMMLTWRSNDVACATQMMLCLTAKMKKPRFEERGFLAPPAGLEPATSWLTVMRSTDWAKEEYGIFLLAHSKQFGIL